MNNKCGYKTTIRFHPYYTIVSLSLFLLIVLCHGCMHKTPKENPQSYSIVYQDIDNTRIND